jgi:hypothetical protein
MIPIAFFAVSGWMKSEIPLTITSVYEDPKKKTCV